MSNIHIRSLNIETFRGIQNLKLEGFSGINIFTGDNNSGKTSVLEVLQTSGNPHSPIMWTLLGRNEKFPNPTRTIFEMVKDLYSVSENDLRIAYSKEDDKNGNVFIELKGSISKEKTIKKDYCKIAHIECEKGEEFSEAEVIKLHIDFFYNGKIEDSVDVYNVTRFEIFPENTEKPYEKYIVHYISPSVYDKECPVITEIFSDNEGHKELIEVLRLFDDDILDIVPTVREYAIPFPMKDSYQIRSKKYGKLMPLSVYGDGLKKALWLVTSVLATKDGVLLIDEFETAIHTSVMNKLFTWIFRACKKYNVQLFLTTHSKEALQKVLALNSDQDFKDEITLYTLYKIDGKNVARRLSAERAIEADENFGQELR
ncbi:AAA family ATPase [Treponema ruminis]|uniref:AAA15 family ATPase/GTPase n=1 Tax=Treponema ruminis TaxID=744515 RepID=A0A7W8GAV6_9SPIR|nr:AAA family ATPase [Treponema ruminis]MBB5226919.1 AAA15 family ATPase/GTPase [Treponema ruminis]